MLPDDMLNSCFQQEKVTLCSSLTREMTFLPDKCTHSSINFWFNDRCNYKNIPTQNYIFRISPFCLYFYIINPISLKLSCLEKSILINMTSNSKIHLEKHCEIYKYSNIHYDSSDPTILSTNEISAFPQLQIYDKVAKKWGDNITPLEKNKLYLLDLKNKSEKAIKKLKVFREEIARSMKNRTAFSFLDDFWYDLTDQIDFIKNKIAISILIVCVIPIIMYILVKLLCCACKKKSSS